MNGKRSLGANHLAERIRTLLGPAEPAADSLPEALTMSASAVSAAAAADTGTDRPLPQYVKHALGRMRLLFGLPFRYLVPDSNLLPPESIRFFTLDPEWLDALIQGALAVGGGSYEQALAQRVLPQAQLVAQHQMPFVRSVARGRVALELITPDVVLAANEAVEAAVSGFLLRSALVSNWPGLSVRAWSSDNKNDIPERADPAAIEAAHPELVVPVLRLERLAPTVLLALFQGVPKLVWLEEPHHSVQFGLNPAGANWQIDLRNEQGEAIAGQTVAVPMRAGPVSGVVDVVGLAQAVDKQQPLPQPRGSAALALQLLQSPARQRFSASAIEQPGD